MQAFDPCGQSVGVFAQEVHGIQNCSIAWRRQQMQLLLHILTTIARQDIASSSAPADLPQTAEATSNHISDNPRQLFFQSMSSRARMALEFPPHPDIALDGDPSSPLALTAPLSEQHRGRGTNPARWARPRARPVT